MPSRLRSACLAVVIAAAVAVAGESGAGFAPVPGHKPVAPGEHPRLFFRKADLPAIRKRAETPEGKEIVARLRFALGGGEAMPTSISKLQGDSGGTPGELTKWPAGSFTMTHGAGFGFLYQLTGDKKYADLARQCVELMFAGTRDIDNRYAWIKPSSSMRGGFALMGVAMAYDFCYEAWDPAFRQKVAKELVDFEQGTDKKTRSSRSSFKMYALTPWMGPHSNHYGPQIGGAGITALAVMGDPGVEDMQQYLDGVHSSTIKLLTEGHGDTAYFQEGLGPGQISTDVTFTQFLLAARTAWGRDYPAAHRSARWFGLQWPMQIIPRADGPWFLLPNPSGSGYGTDKFTRAGEGTHGPSHGGQFVQSFGLVDDAGKAAMLWSYQNFVEPKEAQIYRKWLPNGGRSYDVFEYSHRAITALLHWPIGVTPRNPAEVLPRAVGDMRKGRFIMRNRWQDADDIAIAVTTGGRDKVPNLAWGLQDYHKIPRLAEEGTPSFTPAEDGSGVVVRGSSAIGVDYSKASGADALVVMIGLSAKVTTLPSGKKSKGVAVQAGSTTYHVLTFSSTGTHPDAKAEGDKLVVGGQTVSWTGNALSFKTFAGPPKLVQ